MLYRTMKFKITVIGLILLWVFSQSTYAVSTEKQYYKVEKGDTLYQIASEFGVTVQELVDTNQVRDPKLLQIGQTLRIPKGVSENKTTNENAHTNENTHTYGNTYVDMYSKLYANRYANTEATTNDTLQSHETTKTNYKVRVGDTLYKIAIKYGTTIESLIVSNQIRNPNLLQIGQELKIPTANYTVADIPTIQAMGGEEYVISKVLSATLTAYTAGVESTGKSPGHPEYGITFSGKKVQEGRTIAVDPSIIALGTNVYIEGVGLRTAEDIGSAIKGVKIDVFIEDLEEALEFGVKKNVKVYVLSD